MYKTIKITNLDKISKKDYKAINIAISQAEKSLFLSSKKLAACLLFDGQYILWGKST